MNPHLNSCARFETNDPDVHREVLRANFAVSDFDCGSHGEPFVSKAKWVETKYARITEAFCNSPTTIAYGATPHVKLMMHSGTADFSIGTDRGSQDLPPSRGAVIIPADTNYKWVSHEAYRALALRIDVPALKNVASAMLGDDLQGDLEFRSYLPKSDAAFRQLQAAVVQLVRDLDTVVPNDSFLADSLSQALIVRFLLSSSHQFTDRLTKDVLPPSNAQLRQVEDYIATNWQRELDIEDIAKTFGIGTRSIFRYFKTIRGMTPHEFMRQVRLNNAHHMLESASVGDSVMAIALRCGFLSMGHFAREYRRAFGELPSETLRLARFAKLAVSNLSYRPPTA